MPAHSFKKPSNKVANKAALNKIAKYVGRMVQETLKPCSHSVGVLFIHNIIKTLFTALKTHVYN